MKNVNCPGTHFHQDTEGAVKVFYSYRLNEEYKNELIKEEALSPDEVNEEYQIGYAGTLHF